MKVSISTVSLFLLQKSSVDDELISNRELITSLQQQLSAQREKNKDLLSEKDELKGEWWL